MGGWRNLAWVAWLAVCLSVVGCRSQAPTEGGAGGRRPDKGRKDAEALALSAVHGAADATAKSHPELQRPKEPPPEEVRDERARARLAPAAIALGGLTAVALVAFLILRTRRAPVPTTVGG